MAKSPKPDPAAVPLETDLPRPFYRAAVSSRFIGVAAMTLGAIGFSYLRKLPATTPPGAVAACVLVAAMLLMTGLAYLVLAAWVGRRKNWAIKATFALASVDMTLLGIVVVTFYGPTANSIFLCTICGLFVIALGALTTFLGRSLDILKRLERAG